MRSPTWIADPSGGGQEAHLSAEAEISCAASACRVRAEADAVLPKPAKITCRPYADATQAASPWFFVAGDAGIMGTHVAGAW